MSKSIAGILTLFLTIFTYCGGSAFAVGMVVFDFDDIHGQSKKGAKASAIELYIEALFGSDVTLSQKTTGINSALRVGSGKGAPAITIDFGDNPIESFAVDFQLFKKAKSFTILADGVVINQQNLSKAQRKTGLAGHQNAYFFDTPVHTLQFVGINKKSFAIDNLVINLPLDEEGAILSESGFVLTTNVLGGFTENSFSEAIILNQLAAVPEPPSLLMLAMSLYGVWLACRRARFVSVLKL